MKFPESFFFAKNIILANAKGFKHGLVVEGVQNGVESCNNFFSAVICRLNAGLLKVRKRGDSCSVFHFIYVNKQSRPEQGLNVLLDTVRSNMRRE